jgi:hypothetical protein
MTPNHLASNGGTHLHERFRFAFGLKTTGDLVETSSRETARGAQQNSIPGFFNGEFSAWRPGAGNAYILGQDDLALCGEPGSFHR